MSEVGGFALVGTFGDSLLIAVFAEHHGTFALVVNMDELPVDGLCYTRHCGIGKDVVRKDEEGLMLGTLIIP